MLQKARELGGYKLSARDGEIGKVKEFYFDDRSWIVRYLVADTGGWLSGRRVLISPYALDEANIGNRVIPVDLTRTQIEKSPSLDTDRPVSRQYESEYYPYYGWPGYWGGPYAWGQSPYPIRGKNGSSEADRQAVDDFYGPGQAHGRQDNAEASGRAKVLDLHLRSTADVTGHDIQAQDGEIGHVQDFVIDDETWTIRYLIVDTQNWWPGKKVLVSTRWIERISWDESKVFISLTREAIRNAPEFTDGTLITRDLETKLHSHYDLERYWADELAAQSAR
jgi:uncharacterized protein YrrD